MNILISGANGQIGQTFAELADQFAHRLICLTHNQLDITDRQQILACLTEFRPDIFINAAAYTAVDKAEQESAVAFAVNSEAVRLLAMCCAQVAIPLIHYSTDYIFSGEQQRPYQEVDQAKPLNQYGLSKWAGEEAIRALWAKHIILRVCGVFSRHGNNFVKTIVHLAQTREELKVVADQVTCPTAATAIVQTTLQIAEQLPASTQALWGTYHHCSEQPISWYHFAKTIVTLAAEFRPLKLQRLIPISSAEYGAAAKRPLYTVLDCTKLKKQFAPQPCPWQSELKKLIRTLLT